MKQRAKVFCIGFQKTGTTSLFAALTALGYRTAAVVGRDLSADDLRMKGAALCIEVARVFDAAQDMPWPIFFRELDAAFPGSKFILTVRDSASWFRSIEGHFGASESALGAFVYGADAAAPVGNRARYIEVCEAHERAVREYFATRPDDLLIMDLAAGDGWEKLCAFLGVAAPDEPFPIRNAAEERNKLLFKLRRRLARMTGRYLAPEKI
jgi:hypothetical protein